jgi:hypothetical protein
MRCGRFAAGVVLSFICFLHATPSAAVGAPAEALLSETSVAYVRFDGVKSHAAALSKTTFAKLLREELQPLVSDIQRRIFDALGPGVLSENLLEGIAPEELLELQKAADGLPHLVTLLYENGFVLGVDVVDPLKEQWQVTIVFENVSMPKHREALIGAMRLIGKYGNAKPEPRKIQDRDVVVAEMNNVRMAAWREAEHVVWTIGTLAVEQTIGVAKGKTKNLTDSKVFKSLSGFDRYPSFARGFVDVERIIQTVNAAVPPAALFTQQLGLQGLKRVAFHLGCEDEFLRSTVALHMPGERKGLLKLVDGLQPVSIEDAPPIAPDASFVMVSGLQFKDVFDTVLSVAQLAYGFANPRADAPLSAELEKLEKQLGVNIRQDLLDSLEPPAVLYSAPSEGPFSIGSAVAVKVKDEKKLKASLDTLLGSLANLTGEDISIKKKTYRGVEITMMQFGGAFPYPPTYAIHNGWLVAAFYPQPVQGYIFRVDGKYANWKPSPLLAKVVAAERKYKSDRDVKIVGITQSDPRPTVKELLAAAPFFVALFTTIEASFGGGGGDRFDLSLIPNAQAITEHVTPTVSVTVDDGDSLRIESHSTLPLGFQLTGIQSYFLALAPLFVFGAAF